MNILPIGALAMILLVLILISGFFSGAETALMSLNRYRLRHLANSGHKGAQRTALLLEQPERMISLILLGNNFANILASAIATVMALRLMGEAGIAVATGLMTLIILVFAEVTPKTLATRRIEQFAFFASAILLPLMRILYPLVIAVDWISSTLLRLLGTKAPEGDQHLSSEELRTVLNETAGLVPQRHREMLLNILDLGTVSVNEIMVPRNEIVGIDLEDPWEQVLGEIGESPHNRLLVYRENVDDVVGFVYLRRMLVALRSNRITREYLESVVHDPYFIPEGTTLTVQLLNFQREKRRIGLVIDEYGDIQGLITLEDILEVIVGSFDNAAHDASKEISLQPDGGWLVNGATSLRSLSKTFAWKLAPDGPKTLNGLVLEHLETFPNKGASLNFEGYPITVLEVEKNRVKLVRIDPPVVDESVEDQREGA